MMFAVIATSVVANGSPASAHLPDERDSPGGPGPQVSQVTVVGTCDVGTTAYGFTNPDRPLLGGYLPSSTNLRATPGWTDQGSNFAGTFCVQNAAGQLFDVYCVELLANTTNGVGYNVSEWPAQFTANLGYVNYILQNYFPINPAVPATGSPALKSAIVQAAIWYFTDGYIHWKDVLAPIGVIDPDDQINAPAAAIVAAAIANGPIPPPPTPQLVLQGPSEGSTGALIGPFSIAPGVTSATVTVAGAEVFADAQGKLPLASPFVISPGLQFWIKTNDVKTVAISAAGQGTITPGNVFFFASNPSDPTQTVGQLLISLDSGEVPLTAQLSIEVTTPVVPSEVTTSTTLPTEVLSEQITPAVAVGQLAATGLTLTSLINIGLALSLGGLALVLTGKAAKRRERERLL